MTRLPIIVSVVQLSLSNRSEHVARLIGNSLGVFVEVPKEAETLFFRIKITVDVNKPLKRGIFFEGVDGTKQWIAVTYERLPVLCFLCGIMGHDESNCPTRYEKGFEEPTEGFKHGSWMREITDNRDSSTAGSRSPFTSLHGDGNLGVRRTSLTGSDIFSFVTKQTGPRMPKENNSPNMAWRTSTHEDRMCLSE